MTYPKYAPQYVIRHLSAALKACCKICTSVISSDPNPKHPDKTMTNCNSVSFFLNGKSVTIENPSPNLLLIDYLRSAEVGLIGAKKACGQGGCGACTVILSGWNQKRGIVEHRSINSCLSPVCSLGGLAITTIEGTGGVQRSLHSNPKFTPSASRGVNSAKIAPPPKWLEMKKSVIEQRQQLIDQAKNQQQTLAQSTKIEVSPNCFIPRPTDTHEGMNPVAHRVAINNGTQCGYCTVGFVMNMSAFLAANPSPTKKEIEDIFDGNLCRCTGYKSILTGMKTFACDWTLADEEKRLKCLSEDKCHEQLIQTQISIPFPEAAQAPPVPVEVRVGNQKWLTPRTLEQLLEILKNHPDERTHIVFANTSYGIYPSEFTDATLLVNIKLLEDLYGVHIIPNYIQVGGGITYTEFLEFLDHLSQVNLIQETSRWGSLRFMAERTAGTIVRNAASLAGNTMLVLHHIFAGEPFPSDIFTAMDAVGVEIEFVRVSSGAVSRLVVSELVSQCANNEHLAKDIIILRYFIPKGTDNEVVLAQKTALREINSHSIVNICTRIEIDNQLKITNAEIVFGGIAPYPWHANNTENWLQDKQLSLELLPDLINIVNNEVRQQLNIWQARMADLPTEGFTNDYKAELAYGFVYKAIINAIYQKAPDSVPENLRSSGVITWGKWAVSTGTNLYQTQDWKAPAGQPYVKLMAFYQASGQVHYTHELPVPPLTKNAAFIHSYKALGTYYYQHPQSCEEISADELRSLLAERFEGFYELITYAEIPRGGINYQGMGGDQPILAENAILYYGQVISMVIADTEQQAILIAEYAGHNCVGYRDIDWPDGWKQPILTIDQAIEKGAIFPDAPSTASFVNHIWKITRPGTNLAWVEDKNPLDKTPATRETNLDGNPVFVIENTQLTGDQVHFYMETQASIVNPTDGNTFLIHPSSQSPMEMHTTAALSLGVEFNKINIEVPQLGGGYGGKTEQTKFVIGPTAVAASVLNLPIRIAMKRELDTAMIGKRHAYYGQYQVAVDRGLDNPDDLGLIRGLKLFLWGDGGAFYDCSYIVSNCIQLRIDNAYNIKNFESQLDVVRTNTAPNTAMRGFGDIQGTLILENAIDDAAFSIDMATYDLRLKNMYFRGDVTPFGQALSYCYMRDVWDYVRRVSKYDEKLRECEEFNSNNKWTKRGVYCIPVKYGSGYNIVMLEQAAAIISVYSSDGTISINQGGVDMGQGFMTKVEQLASYVLNVPMELIRIYNVSTAVIPNPTSTGGSTGTAYNGEAVKQAAQVLRQTLMEFGYKLLTEQGPEWCQQQGIDFWNYPEKGWAQTVTNQAGQEHLIWQNLVQLAYQYRVPLVSSFNAPIVGGETPVPTMTFKQQQQAIPGIELADEPQIQGIVDSFTGFTFSAACSMVELDVITGETKILSSDLVYDMGWSLNPAIDIGQIEGAFIQGVGYCLTEKLVWEPEDSPQAGRLNTDNTWRYKVPAITTIPLELNTYLYPRSNSAQVPDNPNTLLSSKEVGEPPLVLATSVFFAIKSAIRASRLERDRSGLFQFDAPATVQEIRRALDLEPEHFIVSNL